MFSLSSSGRMFCCRSWVFRRPAGSRGSGCWCFAHILAKQLVDLFAGKKQLKCPCPAICLPYPEPLLSMKEGTAKGIPLSCILRSAACEKAPDKAKRTGNPSLRKGLRSRRIAGPSPCMGRLQSSRGSDGCPSGAVPARENMACVFKRTGGSKDKLPAIAWPKRRALGQEIWLHPYIGMLFMGRYFWKPS